jgi:oxygen-dependent protoporphyrinogen oxidase
MGPRKGPIFVGIEGGVGRLAAVLAAALRDSGVHLQTKAVVQQVRKRGDLWDVVVGDGRGKYRTVEADAVLLATPATASADLLETVNQAASDELRAIEYADVAVVTLGYPADQARHLRGSGFLVPPVEGLTVKGVTYSSSKWDWVARAARTSADDGLAVLRASVGRAGDPLLAESSDEQLARIAADDVAAITGLPRRPAFESVTRWEQGLPQYTVGHRTRVAEIREWLVNTPGLAVCGAAYEGVGVPACIGSAQAAVSTLMQQLSERREWVHG